MQHASPITDSAPPPPARPARPTSRRAARCLPAAALLALAPVITLAAPTLPIADVVATGGTTYSLSLQTLLLLSGLTFLPAILLMMTGFTRIVIVLSLLRSALGTNTTPPNTVLVGLALFLTLFTMAPTFNTIVQDAYLPLEQGSITFEQAISRGAAPLHAFMLRQTRKDDLRMFEDMAHATPPTDPQAVSLQVLVPAFVTSELKTAFQIGFTLFIPFLIIDMVVASVLMALGMMMVPPVTISLPFKLMLFVLADGWHLLLGSLARSFYQ